MTLSFTGERFLPECAGEMVYEHWHRYLLAQRHVAGKRVLDAASGEGYGALSYSGSRYYGNNLYFNGNGYAPSFCNAQVLIYRPGKTTGAITI